MKMFFGMMIVIIALSLVVGNNTENIPMIMMFILGSASAIVPFMIALEYGANRGVNQSKQSRIIVIKPLISSKNTKLIPFNGAKKGYPKTRKEIIG